MNKKPRKPFPTKISVPGDHVPVDGDRNDFGSDKKTTNKG